MCACVDEQVSLLVIDEIHLLGADRGPILEVIVSRMRYITTQTGHNVRFVGLSTALANARDIGDWLGIDKVGGGDFLWCVGVNASKHIVDDVCCGAAFVPAPLGPLFAVAATLETERWSGTRGPGWAVQLPPVRAACAAGGAHPGETPQSTKPGMTAAAASNVVARLPLALLAMLNLFVGSRQQGYPGKFYCPRMATMNKPTYAAITSHSPEKPVLVFVASRRQTRLTALDLITYAAADENPRQWLQMSEHKLETYLARVRDPSLKHTLAFGIGMHHAGLCETDRTVVEELFVSQQIQIMVCTYTLDVSFLLLRAERGVCSCATASHTAGPVSCEADRQRSRCHSSHTTLPFANSVALNCATQAVPT